jgi:outer membrane protein OmpA-like peptidoglycan-associated protein
MRPTLILALLCGAVLMPAATTAQAPQDTVGVRASGARLHGVVGILGGRFDPQGAPELDVFGARAGVGFGELIQLTGFYWRSVDVGEREFLDGQAWGGEAQLNLNAGFGLTPFVNAGLASLDVDTVTGGTAATLGAGLMIPLGPLRLSVAARDYILGVSGLNGGDDTGDVTHNWLFTAGLTAALGRVRGREPILAARPAPPPAAPSPAETPLAVAPDTVWIARPEVVEGVRNYQSERRIEVPIPLEGSIILRYGPEPAAATITPAVPGAPGAPAAPAEGTPGGAVPVPTPAAPAQVLGDAAVQRIVDGTIAALLPRLEARDAQRQAQLRADLSAALSAQREVVRELVRQELAAQRAPQPDALPWAPGAPPGVAPADPRVAALQAATARLEAARAELARIEAARVAGAPAEIAPPVEQGDPVVATTTGAEVRLTLAELAARHPTLLTTAERERGPAVVVTDAAFETGAALLDERARFGLGEVAAALRGMPDRLIFVHGHSDAVGSEVRNQQLSELRAEVVRSLLVQAGVEAARVHAVGFGAGQPVATNDTAAGRAQNRRVEIVIGGLTEYGGMP